MTEIELYHLEECPSQICTLLYNLYNNQLALLSVVDKVIANGTPEQETEGRQILSKLKKDTEESISQINSLRS